MECFRWHINDVTKTKILWYGEQSDGKLKLRIAKKSYVRSDTDGYAADLKHAVYNA